MVSLKPKGGAKQHREISHPGSVCMAWICLRCLEKGKKYRIPNRGLMVIYHGRK